MAKSYAEKLRDPRWQKMRLELLEDSRWSCQWCGNAESELHVHHGCYLPKKSPWEYEDDQLFVLCAECHDMWEVERVALLAEIGRLDLASMAMLTAVLLQVRAAFGQFSQVLEFVSEEASGAEIFENALKRKLNLGLLFAEAGVYFCSNNTTVNNGPEVP